MRSDNALPFQAVKASHLFRFVAYLRGSLLWNTYSANAVVIPRSQRTIFIELFISKFIERCRNLTNRKLFRPLTLGVLPVLQATHRVTVDLITADLNNTESTVPRSQLRATNCPFLHHSQISECVASNDRFMQISFRLRTDYSTLIGYGNVIADEKTKYCGAIWIKIIYHRFFLNCYLIQTPDIRTKRNA